MRAPDLRYNEILEKISLEHGHSSNDIADKTGVDRWVIVDLRDNGGIYNKLTNKTIPPLMRDWKRICQAYDVNHITGKLNGIEEPELSDESNKKPVRRNNFKKGELTDKIILLLEKYGPMNYKQCREEFGENYQIDVKTMGSQMSYMYQQGYIKRYQKNGKLRNYTYCTNAQMREINKAKKQLISAEKSVPKPKKKIKPDIKSIDIASEKELVTNVKISTVVYRAVKLLLNRCPSSSFSSLLDIVIIIGLEQIEADKNMFANRLFIDK